MTRRWKIVHLSTQGYDHVEHFYVLADTIVEALNNWGAEHSGNYGRVLSVEMCGVG